MKTKEFRKKLALGLLAAASIAALVLFAFSPATTQAAALVVNEKAKIVLTSTGVFPAAKGQAEFLLQIDVAGQSHFAAKATATGLGQGVYSLCAGSVFVDSAAANRGKVVLQEKPSVSFTTLHGLVATIRQGAGCGGTAVLQGTVP